ncbi:MAG: hypothetical protein NT150_13760 [Bacteroidetes bacterium]|nr:hypothetical protein [Bacteroidota bacterium]
MKHLKLLFTIVFFNLSLFCFAQEQDSAAEKQRDFQLTFVTPMGTNGVESHKTINKLSVNILAGVAKGVNGIELGGFSNVILQDVHGIQASGFSNVVLGKVQGAQFSGYVNFNKDSLTGAQFSGFTNVNLGNTKGAQLTGFANYNRKNLVGLQGSGFTNVNLGTLKGAQLAGFANINSGDVDGLQASGFINYARKVKGAQLGFINIADSVDGASIGFLSIVKKGMHQVELSADELFYGNVAVRTGTHLFHNIFSVGAASNSSGLLWHVGYGIGTSFRINDKIRSDLTLSTQHVSKGLFHFGTSELYKVYLGVEYRLAPKISIAAGPTFNLFVSDALLPEYTGIYDGIAPYSILNETNSNGFNVKAWVGGKVAFRFL